MLKPVFTFDSGNIPRDMTLTIMPRGADSGV